MAQDRKTIDDITRTLATLVGTERLPGRDGSGDFKFLVSTLLTYMQDNLDFGSLVKTSNYVLFNFSTFQDRAYKSSSSVIVPPFSIIINGSLYSTSANTTLDTSDLDTGSSFSFGSDYYIYAGVTSGTLSLCLSASAIGSAAGYDNERIIGGFHYGKIRNSATASDVSDAILDYSVWDLQHMPRCYLLGLDDPTTYQLGGMVEVIDNKLWADIYLTSDGGGTNFGRLGYSKINVLPLSGTDGLNAYDFMVRAANVGKRLLYYHEWTVAALGSPGGIDASNLNGWTKTTNTARIKTAAIAAVDADADYINGYNVSFRGCRDCVGNLWEWLATGGGTGSTLVDDIDTGELASIHEDFGERYGSQTQHLAGGNCTNGVKAGARAVNVYHDAGHVDSNIGSRFACDSL
jgi:hypothetical protein